MAFAASRRNRVATRYRPYRAFVRATAAVTGDFARYLRAKESRTGNPSTQQLTGTTRFRTHHRTGPGQRATHHRNFRTPAAGKNSTQAQRPNAAAPERAARTGEIGRASCRERV